MLAPALLLVAGTLLYPLGYSFWTSVSSVNLTDLSFRFVGFQNYLDAEQEPLFRTAVINTFTFAAITIVGTVGVGLATALVLNEPFRGRTLLRMVMIIPWSVSQVVVAVAWGWVYDGTYGLLNAILKDIGLIQAYRGWLADAHLALYLVAVAYIWSAVPFATIMYLAALQGIPQDLYRAARVDGAGALRRFRYITLPALRYATLVVLIVASLDGLLAFTLVYTLTGGGPGTATTVLSWLAYQTTFQQLRLGEGAAMFYMLLFVMVGFAAVYIRLLHRPQRG
jgi:multiple sugar transport system permease protein